MTKAFSARSFRWLFATLMLMWIVPALAQVPKTMRVVVPYPPGSASDILMRLLGEHVSQAHGVTFVVENRPGAAGALGTEVAARAAPDGATMVVVLNPFMIDPLVRSVSYDPIESFTPVCYLTDTPSVLVVNSKSPYKTLDDLITAARAKPGSISLASSGPATATYLAFDRIRREAKVDMPFVPFTGIPPAVIALLGEHVTSVLGNYSNAGQQINSGELRAIAAGSKKRIAWIPDVPTISEGGYKGVEADLWTWLMVPAKTPKPIVDQLGSWFKEALETQKIRQLLETQGQYAVGICGDEFAGIVRGRYDDYRKFVRDSNITIKESDIH